MKTYFEPFVGGGAVFFVLDAEDAFDSALLGDMNQELIYTYRGLSDPQVLEEVITLLKSYPYEAEFYEQMRKKVVPMDCPPTKLQTAEAAARFIYLNRTGFNGLYRVNRKGQFNVPFGRYSNPTICDEPNLRQVSGALRQDRVSTMHADFESQVASAAKGDVVYFDPPYHPRSDTSNFTEYQAGGFGIEAQTRLATCFRRLAEKGVGVLLSNSDTPEIHKLFAGFQIDIIQARRSINSNAERRGPVTEVLVQANLR
jgi:DNA adenine methylase